LWLIEIYQVLVMKNHGLWIYPELRNTSDYKLTDESFDTIALQTQMFAEAVQKRYKELDKSQISLTCDQKYPCQAMSIQLLKKRRHLQGSLYINKVFAQWMMRLLQ
jgi:hypothetical protein